jgi:tape measure domain-containing protein
MSDERFSFLYDFQVNDAPLGRAGQRLTELDKALGRSEASIKRFEGVWKDASGRMREANGRFVSEARKAEMAAAGMGSAFTKAAGGGSGGSGSSGALGLAANLYTVSSALGVVTRMATGAFQAFDRFGDTAISAFGERSQTIRGYTTLLGSRPQADLEFYRAQEFAGRTDFTSAQIEKSQSALMAQGFRGDNLYASLFSAADLAAIMPGDKNETLNKVSTALGQIKAKGKLQGEELTGQLAEAGLNTDQVYRQLLKPLGVKTVGDVQKKLSAGEVSADVAIPAIQRAILAQLNISKAGEYATGASGSLTGLISNRDEGFQNLLKGFDADEYLPAINRYKAALKEQGSLFDVNTKTGKNLSLVLQDLSNTAIEAKSSATGFLSGFAEVFSANYVDELKRARGEVTKEDAEMQSGRNQRAWKDLGETVGETGTAVAKTVSSWDALSAILARDANYIIRPLVNAFGGGDKGTGVYARSSAYGQTLASDESFYTYRPRQVFEGPPEIGNTPQTVDAVKAKIEASAKKKGSRKGSEPGWNQALWWYETDAMRGGSSVARAAINSASVESGVGGKRDESGSIGNQTNHITIQIVTQPGQTPTEIAEAVDVQLVTRLRQLSRAPRNRKR